MWWFCRLMREIIGGVWKGSAQIQTTAVVHWVWSDSHRGYICLLCVVKNGTSRLISLVYQSSELRFCWYVQILEYHWTTKSQLVFLPIIRGESNVVKISRIHSKHLNYVTQVYCVCLHYSNDNFDSNWALKRSKIHLGNNMKSLQGGVASFLSGLSPALDHFFFKHQITCKGETFARHWHILLSQKRREYIL